MATNKERFTLYNGEVNIDFYPDSHRYKRVETNSWIPGATTITGIQDKSGVLIHWALNSMYDHFRELMSDATEFTSDDVLAMLNESKEKPNEKKQASCDIGTVVHEYGERVGKYEIENGNKRTYLSIKESFIPDEYNLLSDAEKYQADSAMFAFDEWVKEKNPEFIETEFYVYSLKNDHGGKCDGLVRIDGKLYVIDYKTSKYIYGSHLYQSSSYMKAKEEEWEYLHGKDNFEKIAGIVIVQVHKDDVINSKKELVHMAGELVTKEMNRGELIKAYKGFKALNTFYRVNKEIESLLK